MRSVALTPKPTHTDDIWSTWILNWEHVKATHCENDVLLHRSDALRHEQRFCAVVFALSNVSASVGVVQLHVLWTAPVSILLELLKGEVRFTDRWPVNFTDVDDVNAIGTRRKPNARDVTLNMLFVTCVYNNNNYIYIYNDNEWEENELYCQVCLHIQGICYSDRSSTVQQRDSNRTGHR